MRGEGRAIVCAVGDCTLIARNRKKEDLLLKEQNTVLEIKLEKVGQRIGKWAELATLIIFLALVVYNVLHFTFSPDKKLFSNATLMEISRIGILAICILIVAIPEGLPLAISIGMAFSVSAMKKDNILIKNIESVQTCALLHEICVGKTGTLTEGRMKVASMQFLKGSTIHENHYYNVQEQMYFNKDM